MIMEGMGIMAPLLLLSRRIITHSQYYRFSYSNIVENSLSERYFFFIFT